MKKCMKRKIFLFFACSVFIAAVLTAIIAPLCYAQAGTERDGKEVNEYEISVPFEVDIDSLYAKDEEEQPVKPEYEDIASKFLTMDALIRNEFNGAFMDVLESDFSKVYVKLAEYFNYGIMYDVVYTIDPDTDAAAYQTAGRNPLEKKIALNPNYFKANRNDFGVLTHELTHTVQEYRDARYSAPNTSEGGNWITEGITDWSRYTFDRYPFSLPSYSASQSYTDSYRVTARFFLWIDQNIDDTFLEQFNEGLKCEVYTSKLFTKITGKTLDELWSLYAASDHRVV